MTDFQVACLEAVQALLGDKGRNSRLEEVQGTNEAYIRLRVPVPGEEVDFYIYEDEAGYFVGGEWRIRESQDYAGPQELIAELLTDLNRELGG